MADTVWVVDDDQSIRWVLQHALEKAALNVTIFEHPHLLLAKLQSTFQTTCPDAIITDIRMPDMDGFTLLEKVHEKYPELPVIIMTAHSDMDTAVCAYESSAFDYLPKPFDINDAINLAKRACEHSQIHHQKSALEDDKIEISQQEIIGQSPAMQELFRIIGRLSKTSLSVLVTGESGTGKELVAKALHNHSPRKNHPFIAINTAAIPKEQLESELFGHEKGAFMGAESQRKGRFEQAHNGTLFLDEIGDMPLELQTRLLRVLADGEFYRVGGIQPIKVDVRVIAATHQNLETLIEEGGFRKDLFHRLNVIGIQIPALRERGEDILLLIKHFLSIASDEMNVEAKTLSENVANYVQSFNWAGNVRQLENTCRWLMVMTQGSEICMADLPPDLNQSNQQSDTNGDWQNSVRQHIEQQIDAGKTRIMADIIPQLENIALSVALEKTNGRKQEAAKRLGWGRNTLTRKLKELNLS